MIAERRHGSRLGRRFIRVGIRFEWLCTRPKIWLTHSGTIRFVVEALSAVIVFGYALDLMARLRGSDRRAENRAWTLIAAVKTNIGNIGLVDALHTLKNYDVTVLTRFTLPGAYLRHVKLPGFELDNADLQDADLRDSDLSRTNLQNANLFDAKLTDADLYSADLRGADLAWENLEGARLD